MAGPEIHKDVQSSALVSLHDLAATFLDFANTDPIPESESISIRPVLEGQNNKHRKYVTSGLNNWKMIYNGRYKLVVGADESPLLYDLQNDPNECENIAGNYPDIVDEMIIQLNAEDQI